MALTFEQLQSANRLRLPKFKTKSGKIAHPEGDGSGWSIAEWTNAMAGETGEACNIAKKIIRGEYEDDPELGIGLLLDEIADVVIYADLVCQQLGRSLDIAVRNKFNEVSERVKSKQRL